MVMTIQKAIWACAGGWLVVPAWAQTAALDNCEPMRERIEANIAGKGVTGFSVTVVDGGANAPGEQVGTCGNGTRKIMYLKGDGATSAAAQPKTGAQTTVPATSAPPRKASKEPILTECKDGTVTMGGNCKP
jgi:hypothetical protein